MSAPSTSALSRLRGSYNRRSARISEASTYSHHDDPNDVEHLHREADQLLTTPYSFPKEFVEQIRQSFDNSPDLGLQPPPMSWTDKNQSSLESHELHDLKKPLAYVHAIPAHREHTPDGLPPHLMWTPSVLHRLPLTALVAFFVATLAALEVLRYFSAKNTGVRQADPKDYYLWTYGPTGIFSIMAAFWALVEYRVKQTTPWQVLQKGPADANKSILLDYVSPWNVISLFRSLIAGHFVVAATVTATLLIKLLIVFSTGLLLLQHVVVQNAATHFVASNRFEDTHYNMSSVDSTASLTVAGMTLLDLTPPKGTTRKYAYQSFSLLNTVSGSDSTLKGAVEAFTADLDCASATLQHYHESCIMSDGCENKGRYLQLRAPDCTTEKFLAFKTGNGAPDAFFGSLMVAKCTNGSSRVDDARLVISAGRFNPNSSLSFTGLVCKPTYDITTNNVSLSRSESLERIDPSSSFPPRSIPQITPWDIVAGINASMLAALQPIETYSTGYVPDVPYVVFDTFFSLLNMTAPQQRATKFLDEAFLRDVSRRTFTSLAVQVARQTLMVPSSDEIAGFVNTGERRLVVHNLSLRAMEATVAALIILIGGVTFFRPHSVSSRDPGSIIGASTVFSHSPSFMTSLRGMGLPSLEKLKAVVAGRHYQSLVAADSGSLTFKIQDFSETRTPTVFKDEATAKWWRPLSATVVARLLVLLTPLALITALETTYQLSRRHDGIANIVLDNYAHYAWLYVPALFMLIVRTVFDTVDFNTRLFQPYCDLHHGSAPTSRSVLVNYFAQTSLHSFWSGLAVRHFAVAFMAASMVMAPFLPIVVSGLFAANEVPHMTAVQADRVDWFNASALTGHGPGLSSVSSQSSLLSALVMRTELKYPQWTDQDVVLPKISLPDGTSAANSSSTFSARLPALRGGLNCSMLSTNRIKQIKWGGRTMFWIEVNVGKSCGSAKPSDEATFDWEVLTVSNMNNGSYFGKTQNMEFGVSGCPTLMIMYGRADGVSVDGLNIATCYPYIDEVEVETTLSIPDLNVMSTEVDETSRKRLAYDLSYGDSAMTWAFPAPMNTQDHVYDNIFSMLVHGGSKIPETPITDFMGASNFTRMSTALSRLYGIVLAQTLNTETRVVTPHLTPRDLAAPPSQINGTLTIPDRVRLQQSLTSTRILEGLLAAMTICAAVSFFLLKSDKVLPLNPCSIAASASLLAESRLVNPESGVLPPEAQWYDDKALKARKLFDRSTFSLKWWSGDVGVDGGQMRYGIDVDDEAEKEFDDHSQDVRQSAPSGIAGFRRPFRRTPSTA